MSKNLYVLKDYIDIDELREEKCSVQRESKFIYNKCSGEVIGISIVCDDFDCEVVKDFYFGTIYYDIKHTIFDDCLDEDNTILENYFNIIKLEDFK